MAQHEDLPILGGVTARQDTSQPNTRTISK